jgi:hypothetical protein
MRRFFFAVAAAVIVSGFIAKSALAAGPTLGTFTQAGQGGCPAVPAINAAFMYLLTDGTVMVDAQSGNANVGWYRLAPDNTGSYACGTWTKLASIQTTIPSYGPRFYAAAVLPDGRLAIEGGEYNQGAQNWTNKGAIYNPKTNLWLPVRPPPGWNNIGDAQGVVLPTGQWMIANSQSKQQALFNANNLTWTATGVNFQPPAKTGTTGTNDEAGWTLLPDGSVFTVDNDVINLTSTTPGVAASGGQTAERWIAGNLPGLPVTVGTWYSASKSAQQLFDLTGAEMGPQVLLPNGTVLAVGATGLVSIYTPPPVTGPPSTLTGSWANTISLPSLCGASGTAQCAANDAPGVLLPSGNILVVAGAVATGVGSNEFKPGVQFLEFNGSAWNQAGLNPVAPTALTNQLLTDSSGGFTKTLLLPNGQVMYTNETNKVWMYAPQGAPSPAWQPTITTYPTVITRNQTYDLTGYLFNGMSQANFYGDDMQNATNYPIVQVTMAVSPNHIYYGRTHDHSSMGVAQTSLPVSTKFELWTCPQPNGAACVNETGAATLVVIANGIASSPVNVSIQ